MSALSAAPPATTSAASPSPIRGRLFYGWIMLGVSVLVLAASSPGQTFGVSIFNESLRQSLELSHSQLASAYMLGTLLAAIPITWIGGFMDRHGLRRSLVLATLAFLGACGMMATAQSWLSLLAAFFLLRLLGPGALAFLSGNILAHWFHRRLGFVEGLRQIGMAGAMAVIPTMNLALVTAFGWRGAYLVLGVLVAGLLLPIAAFVFRNRPEDVGQVRDGRTSGSSVGALPQDHSDETIELTLEETLRARSFWIVTAGTAWFGLVQTAVFFSLVPLFLDRSLTERDAAQLMAVFAAALATTHLVAGYLADHWPARWLLTVGMATFGGSLVCLYCMHTAAMAWACGVLMGISQGIYFGTSQPLWSRYFGRRNLGKVRGILMTVAVASSSVGPFIAGLVRDTTGSFDLALLLFCAIPLPLAVACVWATAPRGSLQTSSSVKA